jgi:hypothetical protein
MAECAVIFKPLDKKPKSIKLVFVRRKLGMTLYKTRPNKNAKMINKKELSKVFKRP